jgi:hypothetical protein
MKHYARILSYFANNKKSVLVIGSKNSGKSTVINTVFEQREKFMTNHIINIGLDVSTQAHHVIGELEKNMAVKSKRLFGSKGSRGTHVILEDLNLPMSTQHHGVGSGKMDSVSCTELLRSIFENSGVWDHEKFYFKEYEDLSFIATVKQSSESQKIKNTFSNLLENFFLIHFNDMSLKTVNNSIFQVVVNSLPNIILEEKYSAFQKLTFISDVKNETGYSLQLRPQNLPIHVKQFANKVIEAVSNVYKEIDICLKRDDERYYQQF